MATLYELAEAEQQLISMFMADDIDEQTLNDTIEGLDIGGKLEDYCMVLRQLEADQKDFKAEADFFTAKAKRAENGIKRLKSGILNYMQRTQTNQRQKQGYSKSEHAKAKRLISLTKPKFPPDF